MSIYLQLWNYRKPLQRMIVRIIFMVPLYDMSSLMSLFSLEATFFIDAIRYIYVDSASSWSSHSTNHTVERSLLIMLHGRPPKDPVFHVSFFKREIDVSDPYMFLFLKRASVRILFIPSPAVFLHEHAEYVQVKPVLMETLILKALGKYNEGNLSATSGYLYISIVYNTSIWPESLLPRSLLDVCKRRPQTLPVRRLPSLMPRRQNNVPLKPVPKFLCVKGILFFSFWQALFISIVVSTGVITHVGPYATRTRPRSPSRSPTRSPYRDALIHLYARLRLRVHGLHRPHDDVRRAHADVLRFAGCVRMRDVVADSRAKLRGEGMDYRTFEPSEGTCTRARGASGASVRGCAMWTAGSGSIVSADRGAHARTSEKVAGGHVHGAEADVVHLAAAAAVRTEQEPNPWDLEGDGFGDDYDLPPGDPDEPGDEEVFEHSRQFMFGDYHPTIDRVIRAALRAAARGTRAPALGGIQRRRAHRLPPPAAAPKRRAAHRPQPGPDGAAVRLKWTCAHSSSAALPPSTLAHELEHVAGARRAPRGVAREPGSGGSPPPSSSRRNSVHLAAPAGRGAISEEEEDPIEHFAQEADVIVARTATPFAHPEFWAAFGESLSCYTIRPSASSASLSSWVDNAVSSRDHEDAASLLDISASSEQLLANLRLTSPSESHSSTPFHLNFLSNLICEAADLTAIVSSHYRTITDEAYKDVQDLRNNADKMQMLLDRARLDVEQAMQERGLSPMLARKLSPIADEWPVRHDKRVLEGTKSSERVEQLRSPSVECLKTVANAQPDEMPSRVVESAKWIERQSGTTKLKAWILRKSCLSTPSKILS
ncbi:organic solute transporter Ostalpha-domain-containing protein [Mycena galericulata]|nr:organic solute transporter Ostalpha-domain-containing protein [Mycena galericulata]